MTRMTDQVGRVLSGRYRLIAPIGAGASAQVFLADDTRLRRRVAVKLLHAALADDEALPAPLPGRGPGRRRPQPPQHRRRLRLGRGRGHARTSSPSTSAAAACGACSTAGHRLTAEPGPARRARGHPGARPRPPPGLRAPRHQARQPPLRRGRPAAHRRLRPGPGPGRGGVDRAGRRRRRHRPLRLARAGPGRAGRRPGRRLLPRPRARRGGHRPGAVRRRHHDRHAHGPRRQGRSTVPAALGPLRRVLARAGQPDPDDRPDAGELAVGLMAAAEELPRPDAAAAGRGARRRSTARPADRDPTLLPARRHGAGHAPTHRRSAPVAAPRPRPPPTAAVATPRRRRRPPSPAAGGAWPDGARSVLLVVAALGVGGVLACAARCSCPATRCPTLVGLELDAGPGPRSTRTAGTSRSARTARTAATPARSSPGTRRRASR